MTILENNSYLITDINQNKIGEILKVKRIENWYTGKIKDLALPENLQRLFQDVEEHIKNQDFSASRKIEKEILGFKLQIKETGQIFSDIQLGFKEKIYFKLEN